MKFSDVLASIIHDMKNSLGMVINTLDEFAQEKELQQSSRLASLQHESKRLNNNLIALLSLYKIDQKRLTPNIEEINVEEFLEEIVVDNQVIARTKGVSIEYACEDALVGYFDEWLIRGVINNLIGNGLRYTSSKIVIYTDMIDNYLVFSIEDDGAGYPQSMIEAQEALNNNRSLSEGNTQLGLYFATMVTRTHKHGDQTGFVKLANQQRLNGGCFSIWLP
jgi:signal transduction histidine kinase